VGKWDRQKQILKKILRKNAALRARIFVRSEKKVLCVYETHLAQSAKPVKQVEK
jgi:hypothetical protein